MLMSEPVEDNEKNLPQREKKSEEFCEVKLGEKAKEGKHHRILIR